MLTNINNFSLVIWEALETGKFARKEKAGAK
jgi:hypothetical protein